MTDAVRMAFAQEWSAAAAARKDGDLGRAFHHLERAHVIGQRRTWLHVRAHLAMLAIGWRRRDRREIAAQLPRIVAAAVFSRLWVPSGNTGGANVGAFVRLPLPDDLAALLGSGRRPRAPR